MMEPQDVGQGYFFGAVIPLDLIYQYPFFFVEVHARL